jgi:endonuclease III
MRRTAEIVTKRWQGDLRAALALPLDQARRALTAFPMIGEPGADKILVFARAARQLALDSNALRVLQRLGLTTEAKDYRATYRSARATLAPQLPNDPDWLIAASQLLRRHGQTLCKRVPDCTACPLRMKCPVGREGP